jgi:hypothetical protein
MQELIQAVKQYARDHYNEGGWDFVVECYEDSEIAEVITGAKSEKQAISMMRRRVSLQDERRREIEAEIF